MSIPPSAALQSLSIETPARVCLEFISTNPMRDKDKRESPQEAGHSLRVERSVWTLESDHLGLNSDLTIY